MKSLDAFISTNPAYCSFAIFHFCQGYMNEAKASMPYPLMVLPVPIILSGEFENRFRNQRIATGLYAWLERNPDVLIELAERIEGTIPLTKSAITFGLSSNIIEISENGLVKANSNSLKKTVPANNQKLKIIKKNAELLGSWCGQAKSAAMVFNQMGVKL
ncbi:three component ABC system middle component [Terasakiella pusilla]|uniref:three component ABC system middle component n=1 Tax=Terasakiella pusilla TaxID=64973 RepID=UPI003AA7CA2F